MNSINNRSLIILHQLKVSPVSMAERLGEQLLTDVKAFLNITLRFAKAFMLGVLQTMLLYTCVSKPASSPIITKTFFLLFEPALAELQALNIVKITRSKQSCPPTILNVIMDPGP